MLAGAIAPVPVFASEKTTTCYKGLVTESGYQFTQEDVDSIIPVLETIEKIPDELLETGTHEEISQFCRANGIALNIYNDNIGETEDFIVDYLNAAEKQYKEKLKEITLSQIIEAAHQKE